jgi:thiol-disulfide isomerase/thioredoxin
MEETMFKRTIPGTAAALALLVLVASAGVKKVETGTKVGQRLPHFKAEVWDLGGKEPAKSSFDSHKSEKPTAYIFMSQTCPYCKGYEKRLAEMSETYGKKGLSFVMVYPTRATPQEKKVKYHKSAGFKGWFLNDKDASVAAKLKIKKTPEIVLVSKQGEIVFRGGIDDNPFDAAKVKKPHFKNACDDLLAGRKVKITSAPLYG